MAIIEIGQKKIINGKAYMKVGALRPYHCEGCDFYIRDGGCGLMQNRGTFRIPDTDKAIEEGGSECFLTNWRECVKQPNPADPAVLRTVTLELVGPLAICDNCAFSGPYTKGCAALQNGEPSLDCGSEGYWRVKEGA